ncbi:MAG TPA: glycosyltransferase family 39 protein [Solirubrobacteraceae bacterium]|nr:glycosyltransferase family 39 protein [Solirubrobacteraceae bacterium]
MTVVVVGAVLRFATLSTQSFGLDESVTVALVHRGFSEMLGAIPHTESTPPLYYILAWGWVRIFGLSEAGLRSLSALCGTAMIPLAFVTAKRVFSPRAGLIAATLTAVSPWLIWYSQEARAYALFALLSLASFACFTSALQSRRPGALGGWAITSALALAAHYFAVFMVVPEALWLLTRSDARRRAAIAVAFVGAAGAALLPLALEQAHGIKGKAGFLQTPLSSRIANIPSRFLLGEAPPAGTKGLLMALALVLVLAGTWGLLFGAQGDPGRLGSVAVLLGAVAVLVPIALAGIGRDYLDARNLIGAWPCLVIALAVGYASIGPRLGALIAAFLAALFLGLVIVAASDETLWRTEYRGVAAALGRPPGPGQRAIVVSPEFNWTPLVHYLPEYPQLPAGNVGVREIDLIGWVTQTPPPDGAMALRQRGFRVVENRAVQKLRLVRLMAVSVTSISRAELIRSHLGVSSATVLIQAAPKQVRALRRR